MISLLHPTARPGKWLAPSLHWLGNCDHPENVEYILAIEPEEFKALPTIITPWPHSKVECNIDRPCLVSGFNTAARASTGNPLVAMADDLWSCPHWDTILLEYLDGKLEEEAVVWSHNGTFWHRDCGEEVHPILTRKYYERYGYVFNPVYGAWYADTEFAAVARLDGVVVDARERLRFDHRHFSEGKSEHDAVNARADAGGNADMRMFQERSEAGFPRPGAKARPLISLIHTTARPGVCDDTIRKLLLNTDRPDLVEHCLTYEERFFPAPPAIVWPDAKVRATNGTPVDGYNLAAEMSTGSVLFFFSDDVYPYPHWDTRFLEALGDLSQPKALLVRVEMDRGRGLEVTHDGLSQFPTCTRAYYEKLKEKYGGFLNPCYFARFSDMEYTVHARQDGVIVDARQKIALYHIEERDTRCVMEHTREKMLQEHIRDEKVFFERQKLGFPKEWPHWSPAS